MTRLERFQEQLTAFRGEVESMTFVYRVPGFRRADRLYLIRGGRLLDAVPLPKNSAARTRATSRISRAFARSPGLPGGLSAHEAAEILLVARWFRLHPEELERTQAPDEWLDAHPAPAPPQVDASPAISRTFANSAGVTA